MRDIRSDLRDRLDEIAAERQRLDQLERSLRELLRAEDRRWGLPDQPSLPLNKHRSKPTRKPTSQPSEKTSFVLNTMSDRRIWPMDDLVRVAEEKGIDFGGKSPKRVLHFVLLGMIQRRIVEKIGKSDWRRIDLEDRGNDAGPPRQGAPASFHS